MSLLLELKINGWRRLLCMIGMHSRIVHVTTAGRKAGLTPIVHTNCPRCGVVL